MIASAVKCVNEWPGGARNNIFVSANGAETRNRGATLMNWTLTGTISGRTCEKRRLLRSHFLRCVLNKNVKWVHTGVAWQPQVSIRLLVWLTVAQQGIEHWSNNVSSSLRHPWFEYTVYNLKFPLSCVPLSCHVSCYRGSLSIRTSATSRWFDYNRFVRAVYKLNN